MWKIRNATDFIEDFIIAQASGIVPRYDNQVVPVTYIACRVGVILNKPLIIDVSSIGFVSSVSFKKYILFNMFNHFFLDL